MFLLIFQLQYLDLQILKDLNLLILNFGQVAFVLLISLLHQFFNHCKVFLHIFWTTPSMSLILILNHFQNSSRLNLILFLQCQLSNAFGMGMIDLLNLFILSLSLKFKLMPHKLKLIYCAWLARSLILLKIYHHQSHLNFLITWLQIYLICLRLNFQNGWKLFILKRC